MSYQALARKWRPQTFDQMMGQSHVLQALSHALDQNRLHHAYLFTGTRGVGKTSIARLLAKCLNCEKGISSHPCNQCQACIEITQGRFIDVLEIDAASRTRVEDTREILENIQYRPSVGRFKIYLIDEIHMLSTHSFNALLKTLEEPPEHVKFLLATTDPDKLPVTILSRCLRFHLTSLNQSQIQQHLEHILKQENLNFEPQAIVLLSQAASGSLRDALSLLDQAIAFGNLAVREADVKEMLGISHNHHAHDIVLALAHRQHPQIFEIINQYSSQASSYRTLLEQITTLLYEISFFQALQTPVLNGQFSQELLELFVNAFTPEEIQLYYQIALIGKRDLPLAPNEKIGFEMVMLRMIAFMPESQENQVNISISPQLKAPVAIKNIETSAPVSAPTSHVKIEPPEPISHVPTSTDELIADWASFIPKLKLDSLAKKLLTHCIVEYFSAERLSLILDAKQSLLLNDMIVREIEKSIKDYLKSQTKVDIKVSKEGHLNTPAKSASETQEKLKRHAISELEHDKKFQFLANQFEVRADLDNIELKEKE